MPARRYRRRSSGRRYGRRTKFNRKRVQRRRYGRRGLRRALGGTANATFWKEKNILAFDLPALTAGQTGYTGISFDYNGDPSSSNTSYAIEYTHGGVAAGGQIPAGIANAVVNHNSSYSSYYESQRLAGIKIKWIPHGTIVTTLQATTGAKPPPHISPMYILWDTDGIASTVTTGIDGATEQAIQQEVGKVRSKNWQKGWSKFFKAPKFRLHSNLPQQGGYGSITVANGCGPRQNIAGMWRQPETSLFNTTPSSKTEKPHLIHLHIGYWTYNLSAEALTNAALGTMVMTYYWVYKDRL